MSVTRSPLDLAGRVHRILSRRVSGSPGLRILRELLSVMFAASLLHEEGQSVLFHIVYLDPANPDPHPPQIVREDRWVFVPLATPLAFTVPNVIKLARATDPRTSSIVVFPDTVGQLDIWGFVDQGIGEFAFRRFEPALSGAYTRSGLFHASIMGLGHVEVQTGWETIGELKRTELVGRPIDALHSGPLRAALEPGIDRMLRNSEREIVRRYGRFDPRDRTYAAEDWLAALTRLLLRVRDYRHGGALLLSPTAGRTAPSGLNVKHPLRYARIERAIRSTYVKRYGLDLYHEAVSKLIDTSEDALLAAALLDRKVEEDEGDDAEGSLDGALWFVSLLSRVDGLVLLTPQLRVEGFGVEITVDRPPVTVLSAVDADASKLMPLDYNHFGTRHRSMMRYCFYRPGSVGFVVSQDGDVRAVTRVAHQLVVWENLQLHRL